MAEFVQMMKDWRRMCKAYSTDDESCCAGCPVVDFHEHGCGAIFEMEDGTDWQRYAETIMSWAKKHPEPIYPTWREGLCDIGLIHDYTESEEVVLRLFSDITPADIAEKLGIESKEGMTV